MGSSTVPLLTVEHYWECPNCGATHVTRNIGEPHIPFHDCPGLHGVLAPFVPAGTKCKVEMRNWEDYVGSHEGVRYDSETGRPVSSVVTTRDDGMDCAVFATCAVVRVESG